MHNSSFSRIEIGVIADTHGLLRPGVVEMLAGCRYIFHAGDIGNPEILEQLKSMAPVFAVQGNIDRGPWAKDLPIKEVIEINGGFFYLVHRLEDLDLDPSGGFQAVVYGHSHMPESYRKQGVLYFNPGSAGPRRFRLPVTMGRITIVDGRLESEIIDL